MRHDKVDQPPQMLGNILLFRKRGINQPNIVLPAFPLFAWDWIALFVMFSSIAKKRDDLIVQV